MAGASRNSSPIKRLMSEIQTYQNDPNEALLELGPKDDDVMHWTAVMKGLSGTAYEGMFAVYLERRIQCYLHRSSDECTQYITDL
jgi:ubiquitin-protein ligase